MKRTRAAAATNTPVSAKTSGKRGRAGAGGARKKGRYNASGSHVNGVWCASASEAERYRQLLDMEKRGRIENLRCQVSYQLRVHNHLICTYRADFSYDVVDEGDVYRSVVEDVKGYATDVFKLKHKLFDALHPVPLSVIYVKAMDYHPTITPNKKTREGYMHTNWRDRLPEPATNA